MDVGQMLQMMRDPLGAPLAPGIFQILLVVTWVIHIFFVTLALGSSAFSLYAFWRGNAFAKQLARITARITPNAVGLGIVTGIAPLLFVQTIYDPMWYAANTLTGLWSTLFIFVMMGGYSLAYLFYLKGSKEGKLLWSNAASFVLLFFAGWIMHVLANVSIYPEQWREWYAPNGIIDTSGARFHAFNIPRLTFLLPLQAALSLGVVLILFAWYFRQRDDANPAFLDWCAQLGKNITLWVIPFYAISGLLWALTQGKDFNIEWPLTVWLAGLSLGLFIFFRTLKNPSQHGRLVLGVWLFSLLQVAIIREVVRVSSLARFGYSVSEYRWGFDWGSTVMFTITSLVGICVIAFIVMVLYASGRKSQGVEISPMLERFGSVAINMLGAWFGFFLLLGLYTVFFIK